MAGSARSAAAARWACFGEGRCFGACATRLSVRSRAAAAGCVGCVDRKTTDPWLVLLCIRLDVQFRSARPCPLQGAAGAVARAIHAL